MWESETSTMEKKIKNGRLPTDLSCMKLSFVIKSTAAKFLKKKIL